MSESDAVTTTPAGTPGIEEEREGANPCESLMMLIFSAQSGGCLCVFQNLGSDAVLGRGLKQARRRYAPTRDSRAETSGPVIQTATPVSSRKP